MDTATAISGDAESPLSAIPAPLRGLFPFLVALPLLLLFQWTLSESPFAALLVCTVGVNIVLAVSLNIVNGMTGQFSIGHAGFMAVGAYLSSVLSLQLREVAISGIPVWASDQLVFLGVLLVGGLTAAFAGFLVGLPSLRLRGDYLAIVTLGFGEIIRVVVQNTNAFGRALGLSGIPQTSTVASVGFWVFLVVLVARRIAGSSHGRSLWAIREDEVAAEAMGVNTTAYKVRAFVVSSFFAGIAGGLFAHLFTVINPGSFTFVKSMEIVVMVVLGGLGSTTGAIVAATFLTLLPEGLRSLFTYFGAEGSLAQKVDQIRMPVYGLLLVALMLSRPQGLFGTREIWDVLPRWIPRRRKGIT
jgi:branched-chain amino acid transport system permease protein